MADDKAELSGQTKSEASIESIEPHNSVLLQRSVEELVTDPDGVYIDGTFGRGGHSRLLLSCLSEQGRVIATDRDPAAIAAAVDMQKEEPRLQVLHAEFAELTTLLSEQELMGRISGLLLDLGVSSPQLDDGSRGFSFLRDGPLDMRMNPEADESAASWINRAEESDIADVLFQYGEEKFSRRMARAVVSERQIAPIETTARLAEIIKEANPSWERDKHPATRAFQGIRIFINRELDQLKSVLDQSLEILKPGGRMAIISFHSLEDRIVKKFIAQQTKGDSYPRDLPIPASMLKPALKSRGKAIKPSQEEVQENPRARSAVLRVAERLG